MPAELQTPRISVRAAFNNAAGPMAVSNKNLAQFALPSYALIVISSPGRLGGSLLEWIFIATAAYLATVGFLVVARETFLSGGTKQAKPILTTLALLAAGLVRGFAVWGAGSAFGLVSASELVYRLYAGPIFVFGAIATLAIYNSSIARHQEVVAELEGRKFALESMQASIRQKIANQQEELLQKTREILVPVIEKLRSSLRSSDVSELSKKLQESIETVVRPLSHDIAQSTISTEEAIDGVSRKFATSTKWQLPRRVSVGEMFVPSLTTFGSASVSLTVPSALTNSSPLATAAIAVILCLLFTWLARVTLQRLHASAVIAGMIVAFVMGIQVLVAGLFLLLVELPVSAITLWQYFLMLLILAMVGFAMQISRTQRNEDEIQMASVVRDLGVLTAQLRQELWVNRRRIASVIHGPIQSALYASAIRLGRQEFQSTNYLETIESDIVSALKKLETIEETESIDVVLAQIKNLWDGVVEVNLPSLNEPWAQQVRANAASSACLIEVIREAVSNAAKHGKASKVWVEVSLAGQNLLKLRILNNGLEVNAELGAGFGSSILDEVSLNWHLFSESDRVCLEVNLPI